MKRTLAPLLVVCGMSSSLIAQERSAADLLPANTIVYAEIVDPPELISTVFDHPLRSRIESLAPYQMAVKTDGYRKFLAGRKFVELQLGMEWREALETVTANGIHIGIDADTNGFVLLVQSRDVESLDLVATRLLALSKLGENSGASEEGEYRGVTAYRFDESWAAVVDDWLMVTNKAETGKAVLDRMLDGADSDLNGNPHYQSGRAVAVKRNSTAWGFVDLETLRNAGAAKNLFEGKSDNPLVELLVGGILDVLQETPVVTSNLIATTGELAVEFGVPSRPEWISEERNFFFGPDQAGKGPQLPNTRDTLFTLSAYRDASEMWLRAGDLFNEKVNDGIAEADANLTTFFSGKDFGEDILGSLTPQIGFVATRQDFSGILPTPTIRLPQFALVLNLREPEKMAREMKRTFQSMVGFFNVVGAMEGRPQLEMDMDKLDNGAQLVTSVYLPEDGEEESKYAPILFNFSPSVGFHEERFVVSSTAQLARELVVSDPARQVAPSSNTVANLQAETLQTVLRDNRNQLISQNMLEEGNSRDEAEAAIDLVLEAVGYFRNASLNLASEDGRLSLKFRVEVQDE